MKEVEPEFVFGFFVYFFLFLFSVFCSLFYLVFVFVSVFVQLLWLSFFLFNIENVQGQVKSPSMIS